jgi:hypothetical protein
MSFNLAARVNDLEILTNTSLASKADRVQPTFIGPATIKDDQNNVIANFASPSIIFNVPVICNSSLSAPITIQQKKYVDDSITALINGAPTTLDTLEELATAVGNDQNLAAHFTTSIANLNNLININASTNSTILNTNGSLVAGQYNPATGITNPLLTLDTNSLNVLSGQFIVNASSGVQTTNSLYNRSSIDTLLQNYTQQNMFLINNISRGGNGTYLKLCTFTMPTMPTNVKFTITYNVAYPDYNQSNVLIIQFFFK